MENIVLQLSKEYPAILITGPRQVGKTTMLQKLMEGTNRNHVTLDDLNERALAKEDPEMFFQMHKILMRYNMHRNYFRILKY